jgi:serine/threonine protein kinase
MNTYGWSRYYRMSNTYEYGELSGARGYSNLLYTPLLNHDNSIMCIHYRVDNVYRQNVPTVSDETLSYFFNKEIKYLQKFSDMPFVPKILEIDEENKRVFIEWGGDETLGEIINNRARSLDEECPDWEEQLYDIVYYFIKSGHYKLSLYPNCFFLDKENRIKTLDFYAVIPFEERYVDYELVKEIIGEKSCHRFTQSSVNGKVDFNKFFDMTMNMHLAGYWNYNNPFPQFYNKLHEEISFP